MQIMPDPSKAADWLSALSDKVTEESENPRECLSALEEFAGKCDDGFAQFLLHLLADKLVRDDFCEREFEEMIANKVDAAVSEYRSQLLFLKRGIVALSKGRKRNFVMEYAKSGTV